MEVILDIGSELVDVNRRTYRATWIDVGRIGRQKVRRLEVSGVARPARGKLAELAESVFGGKSPPLRLCLYVDECKARKINEDVV